jgi:septal ring factor EnvC (AmiA/AmiB activator)
MINAVKKLVVISVLSFSLALILFLPNNVNAATKESTDKKLNDVQQAIKKQKNAINQVSQKRKSLEKKLKKDDMAIAKVAKAINQTDSDLKTTKKDIKTLAKTKTELTAKKLHQENLLSQQLRTAYTTGHHDYLKLILNQEQAASVQRTLTYYQYLNDARIKEIEQFQLTLSELLEVTTAHRTKIENLEILKTQQNQQRLALQKNKGERAKTLTSLSKELLSSQQQLAKLETEESNLVTALKQLEALVQRQINLNGLSKLKRKLRWPVKGRLMRSFGSQKQGYLRWKGVLISAPNGRQVETIHNGTVLFADWLKGYGLVTVIDHGNGYMSLYGQNQTLLKNVGDQVETGEPIALVGQSGGQNQPGLYFEIRHKGKAVNPKLWIKR